MPTETSLLILNTSHYQGNGVYEYNFSQPIDFTNSTVSVASFTMYNSIFNVKTAYSNTNFKIIWVDGTEYSFTIPDGYYEFEDIQTYIEQQCLLNGLYVTKDEGTKDIFFFDLSVNPSRYKCQLDVYYVPTSANATTLGYSKPSNALWSWPLQNTTPQIEFSSGLMTMVGMTTQSIFPLTASSTDQTFLSNVAPKILQVFTILLACNLCESKGSPHPRLLSQVEINAKFGNLIQKSYASNHRLKIRAGQYSHLRIELLDPLFKPLEINDTDFAITLLIETSN